MQKFVAKTSCIVESISRKDFFRVARKYYELADLMDFIRRKFEEEEVDFDFFRFRAIRKKAFDENLKNAIRLKFRVALNKWMKLYKAGKVDLPEPLRVIKQFQAERGLEKKKMDKLRKEYQVVVQAKL